MRIEVERTYQEKATPGKGRVLNAENETVFDFLTLELPWKENQRSISCIPAGEYLVFKMPPNGKRKYEYFWVQDVPGRTGILWHPGNYTHQIRGCLLPGEEHVDMNGDGITDITNTTATLKILTALMPEKFKLTIR